MGETPPMEWLHDRTKLCCGPFCAECATAMEAQDRLVSTLTAQVAALAAERDLLRSWYELSDVPALEKKHRAQAEYIKLFQDAVKRAGLFGEAKDIDRLAAERDAARAELATLRAAADVLAAEVRAWKAHAEYDAKVRTGKVHPLCGDGDEVTRALEQARAATNANPTAAALVEGARADERNAQ